MPLSFNPLKLGGDGEEPAASLLALVLHELILRNRSSATGPHPSAEDPDFYRHYLIHCSRKNSGGYGTGRRITTMGLVDMGDRDHDLIGGG